MNALQPLKFRRILVPIDELRPSHNSLAVAAGMARASEATVLLAHVAEMSYSQDRDETLATYGEHTVEDFRKYGEDLLQNTAESETFSGLEVEDGDTVWGPGTELAGSGRPGKYRRHREGEPWARDLGNDAHGFG